MEQVQQVTQQVISRDTEQQKSFFSSVLKLSLAFFCFIPAFVFWISVLVIVFGVLVLSSEDADKCNVARIPLQGVLMATDNGLSGALGFGAVTSADSVVSDIVRAEEDEHIVAIVVDVDSPGGTPVAGDEIMQALHTTSKPTVAIIRDRGTSAAYWAAAGADYIVASPVSDVGSIGVTMSYLELASSTEYQGSRWVDISSGEYKDAGHPERVLKSKEQDHFQHEVDAVHEYMVNQIAEARDTFTRDELATLSDGRAYLGAEALSLGLIDAVGGFEKVLEYLKEVLWIDDTVVICPVSYGGLEDLLY